MSRKRVWTLLAISAFVAGCASTSASSQTTSAKPDAMSAGGHFNPTNKPQGNPAAPEHHGGDVPMLMADASGNATLEAMLDTVTLGSGANSLIGRAVVVHTDADDYKTQPTGNSGARVACGVIVAG